MIFNLKVGDIVRSKSDDYLLVVESSVSEDKQQWVSTLSLVETNSSTGGMKIKASDYSAQSLTGNRWVFPSQVQSTIAEECGEFVGKLNELRLKKILKQRAFLVTDSYYDAIHLPSLEQEFTPGKDYINYAGRIFGHEEMHNLIDSSLDFWLTAGPYTQKFEKRLRKKLGVDKVLIVNSGSSANLLAFSTLTSPQLGERAIKRGDEVITVAAGFPTTVTPTLQFGAVPVFVDVTVEDGTYNIDIDQMKAALSNKTKAVMVAHTLGNPFNLSAVTDFCKTHNLWLVEDNCDALGSKYNDQYTGTFGDIGTSSFYPPHHITMGEGGAVYTKDPELSTIAESIRDWGRDCWCPSGNDDTCGKRFEWQFSELPEGYDHKYVYGHFGYNLKATDMQAAIGLAQLERIDDFAASRHNNWKHLRSDLAKFDNYFYLPNATENSSPSWFGFLLTVREDAPFKRNELTNYLEQEGVQTRLLFAGNLTRHPCFDHIRGTEAYRVVGDLSNADLIMNNSFWVGVYPGITKEKIDYVVDSINKFIERCEKS